MLKESPLIPIERYEGVTLYGRMGRNGRLGNYEVHSEVLGYNGQVYAMYKDARKNFNAAVGVSTDKLNTRGRR